MTVPAGAAASPPLPRRGGVRYQRWRDLAACRHADPALFFPESGGSAQPARRICAACPVTAECLEYAVARREVHGIWGGLAERERYGMRSRGAAA